MAGAPPIDAPLDHRTPWRRARMQTQEMEQRACEADRRAREAVRHEREAVRRERAVVREAERRMAAAAEETARARRLAAHARQQSVEARRLEAQALSELVRAERQPGMRRALYHESWGALEDLAADVTGLSPMSGDALACAACGRQQQHTKLLRCSRCR